MRLDIDYTNHPRWNDLSKKHKETLTIPNLFANILNEYKNQIPNIDELNSAIETGTYDGKTSTILANHFDVVFTIELFPDRNPYDQKNYRTLYEQLSDDHQNLTFLFGSSEQIIPEILSELPDERFMFLLDSHNNITSPLREELKAIKEYSNNKSHVFLIDDCNDLGSGNFPSENELKELLYSINPNYNFVKIDDGNKIMLVY